MSTRTTSRLWAALLLPVAILAACVAPQQPLPAAPTGAAPTETPAIPPAPVPPPTDELRADSATGPAKPDYVTALEAAYGAPSQVGFGSAVFYEPRPAAGNLEQAALAMAGILVAGRRDDGADTFLVFLLD